jgi:CheY-like chemotaxis protein
MARILIIDDDAEMRQLLADLVTAVGHEVFLAADGAEGLRVLQEKAPHLIITDIVMPKKDGLEVLLEIRSRNPRPKTIAMSGTPVQWTVLQSAHELGVDRTLPKPFTRSGLIEAIDAALAGD